jgi:hypothetical protein
MDYKKTKAALTTVPRNLDVLSKETGNIYETVMILAKRANQISSELKEELNQKLQELHHIPIIWKKFLKTGSR